MTNLSGLLMLLKGAANDYCYSLGGHHHSTSTMDHCPNFMGNKHMTVFIILLFICVAACIITAPDIRTALEEL